MFKQALEEIVGRTDEAVGALIMGTDGIAVEKILGPEGEDANLDVAAAAFAALVRSAQRTGADTGLGALHELTVTLEHTVFIVRLLTAEYFVVLALKPGGNFGRGRFELRKAELQLAREFIV